MVSSICAVLAETDVINMVSRGISTPDILKGIHLSMAGRYTKLLRAIDVHGQVAITGGLSADTGLAQASAGKGAGGWSGRGDSHPSRRHLRRRAGSSSVGSVSSSHAGPARGGAGMSGATNWQASTAIVTGGSGGIGSAIVRSLQEAGAVATSLDLSPPPEQ